LELLNTIGHTSRNGEEREEVRRKIGENTLGKGNPATLGQIQHFSTGQATLHFNHNTIPDRLSFVTHPKRHTKILQRGREEVPQPKMTTNSAALSTLPTVTKRDLAKIAKVARVSLTEDQGIIYEQQM
jgi:hypothetical protein